MEQHRGPETDPHIANLFLTKEQRQYNGTRQSATNGAGTTGHPHVKKKKGI